MNESDPLKHLEDFILRNPQLEKLENLLQEFNIFETLKLTHSEIKHSNVIAWLLNPSENHGLSSYFLRQFFKFIVSANRAFFEQLPISLFDFELFKYTNIEVRREWKNTDILVIIIENDKKVVVTIENKVKTAEHSNQLTKYRDIVENDFKDFVKLFVYLTPDNLIPSDDAWIPFTYDTISDVIKDILNYKKDSLSSNVVSFLSQYNTILRRYIVGQSEVENIAIEICKKHKDALDIIFQYKPDIYLELSSHMENQLKKHSDIMIDTGGKTAIRFTTKKMDSLVKALGEGWTKSKRILLFEIYLYENRVALRLYIGPGDTEYREVLRQFFLKKKDLFKFVDRKFGSKWHAVYQDNFLTKKDFEGKDSDELKAKVDKKLTAFFEKDLPMIENHFNEAWE